MTKRFFYFASLLCALTLGFTSCEKDDGGDNKNDNGQFGTEQYEAISGLYEVDNTASGIKSIELTAGGEYIIVFTGGSYSPAKTDKQISAILSFNHVATRAVGENHVSGTYTYNEEDDEIILNGYGSLLVYSRNEDGSFSAFVLETESGRRIELDVTKQEEMPNSDMTKKLCRTWKPKDSEVIYKMTYAEMGIKNQVILDVKYSYDTEEFTIKENSVGFTEKEWESLIATTFRKVVFSKAGTYMQFHEYEGQEISILTHWRWNDEKNGYLLYYYGDEQDYEYNREGIVQISFSNNRMCITESVEMSEDGVTIVGTIKYNLVEASTNNAGGSDNSGNSGKEEEGNNGNLNPSNLYGYWQAVSQEWQKYINGELVDEDYEGAGSRWGMYLTEDGEHGYWYDYGYGDIDTEYSGTYSYKNGKLIVEEDGDVITAEILTLTSKDLIVKTIEEYTEYGDEYKYIVTSTYRKANIK